MLNNFKYIANIQYFFNIQDINANIFMYFCTLCLSNSKNHINNLISTI